jgi:hypothetical protein
VLFSSNRLGTVQKLSLFRYGKNPISRQSNKCLKNFSLMVMFMLHDKVADMDMDIDMDMDMDMEMDMDINKDMDTDKNMDMDVYMERAWTWTWNGGTGVYTDVGMERAWAWKQTPSIEFLNMSSLRPKDLDVVYRIPVKILILHISNILYDSISSVYYRMV